MTFWGFAALLGCHDYCISFLITVEQEMIGVAFACRRHLSTKVIR